MPKFLLFDLDGTLTDPQEGIVACFRHALEGLRIPDPGQAALLDCIGPPLQESFARLAGAERAADAVRLYRERFSTVGLFENAVYPGIPEVLAELRARGRRLFVATSKPHVFATRILEHFGLSSFFERVYGSELDGTRTKKGELIAWILEREGLRAEDGVMIGDRKHDVIGASENGMPCWGVLWGYGSREELTSAGARAFASSPSDILKLARDL